ncbi:MAG: hypothetical protein AAFQ67_05570, partial [Pseudomonadota bacterium]
GAEPGPLADVVRALEAAPDRQRGSIVLEMALDGGQAVDLKLPSTYAVGLGALQALKGAPGVERVDAA